MNTSKKSSSKIWLLVLTGVIIVLLALFRHPSFKPMLSYNQQQTWQDFIAVIETGSANEAQELWKFREFFSRGKIDLAKFDSLSIPNLVTKNYSLPDSFTPHTKFVSDKVFSIEGTINSTQTVFLSDEELSASDFEVHLQTDNMQILKNKDATGAFVIALFDLETASQANGYLYFDYRNKEFKAANQDKKWLVVSYIIF